LVRARALGARDSHAVEARREEPGADPRDSTGRAALQAELMRLNAEVRGRSEPDPDDPDPFSTDGIWSDPA